MVLRKKMPSLLAMSLQTLENCVLEMCRTTFEDQFSSLDDLVYWSEKLVEYINDEVIWRLHDDIARHILQAAAKFSAHMKTRRSTGCAQYHIWADYKGLALVRLLASIVPYLKIALLELADWPEPVQSVLIQLLHKTTNLKNLDTRCRLNSAEPEQFRLQILSNFDALTNLTSFNMAVSCTDEIIAGLSERCRSLRSVLVYSSLAVTDRGCECLQELRKLREVRLDGTAVTAVGYGKLLTKTRSQNLHDIGFCGSMRKLLHLLDNKPQRTYQLRRLQCSELGAIHLASVCRYFPYLVELSVDYISASAPDFYCLAQLGWLSRIKVHKLFPGGAPFPNPLGRYLTVKGESLKSLSLGRVEDLLTLHILIIANSCPNIESLEFQHCKFADGGEFPNEELSPTPFQNLTKLDWSLNSTLAHAEFVLRYAFNIETLVVMPGVFSVDDLFVAVFNHNPLNELKTLRVENPNNMSAFLINEIVNKCRNISWVGNFQNSKLAPRWWLKKLENAFKSRNYNLTLA